MQQDILFGTYTKKTSQGIYHAILDTETKTINTPKNVIEIDSPTYLKLSNHELITVAKESDLGGVAAYSVTNEGFKHINSVLQPGANPCYVGIDEARQLVYTANYHKGQVDVYQIKPDQSLALTDTVTHQGNGPRPEQGSAHVHYTDLTPDNRLVVVDLGCDEVYTYDVSAQGKLSQVSVLKMEAGFGPRHIVFAPNGQYAYLAGELSSQLAVLKYDQATGSFEVLQIVKTIPETWTQHNGAAAIRISNDGKFVYLSNRGHNSLAVFAVKADHLVEFVEYADVCGDFPRDFDLDPSQKFVVVTNQNTDNATLFARDLQSGKLTCLQKDIVVPEGVCVCFTDQL